MEECFLLCCSPFSNTLLLNSFMISLHSSRSVLYNIIVGCIETFRGATNWLPGPGKHFLIEIPLRKWCHSHFSHMRHSNVTSNIYYNSVSQCTLTPHKCSANSSIHPILCNTSPMSVRPSAHSFICTV